MVREITSQYKGMLLDQFGVLHDGAEPYPGAIDAVASIAEAGVSIMLLSNSSRRSAGATARLEKMGFNPNWFAGVITSGEVTHTRLASRPGAFWQGLGRKCIHISWASRGAISLDGLGLSLTDQPEDAEFILAHGTQCITLPGKLASGEDCSLKLMQLEELKAVLDACARQTQPLPMIVANPDIVTVSGADLVTMPGTLGKHYAQAGGDVHLMGKPAGIIYADALQELGLEASQVVAVGDSLEHDIAGAQGQGIDTLFICGGIHAKELPELPEVAAAGAEPDSDRASAHLLALLRLCADYSLAEPPTFVMQQLR